MDKRWGAALTAAFLGISVGSPYYSRQRIEHYLAWAALKYQAFAFLVGDSIAKYTIAATKHLPLDFAAVRAEEIANNLCVMLESACRSTSLPVKIYRWDHVEKLDGYSELLAAISSEYASNDAFRRAVRSQVWRNLGSRIAVLGEHSHAIALCDRYIVEEIAGLISMSEATPFHLELYPGEDLIILGQIYADEFPLISAVMPVERKRSFEHLQINVDD